MLTCLVEIKPQMEVKWIWWTHRSYIEKYAKLSSGSQLNIAA
jgi:hypothetical protein